MKPRPPAVAAGYSTRTRDEEALTSRCAKQLKLRVDQTVSSADDCRGVVAALSPQTTRRVYALGNGAAGCVWAASDVSRLRALFAMGDA